MLTINGRDSLAGRQLYDRLGKLSEDCLLGHMVLPTEEASKVSDPRIGNDIIPHDLLVRFDPNLIYVEGGLFAGVEGEWRIPRPMAEKCVRDGAIMIVLDVDYNRLGNQKMHYKEATSFFQVSIDYGLHDDDEPVYGADLISNWGGGSHEIVCKPDKMIISEWLRPIYEEITEILVGCPVRLRDFISSDIVASGNRDSTGTLHHDLWVDRIDSCPFASAAKFGLGYAVFIAGSVSSDVWLERCPDNVQWLTNLGVFLLEQASRDRVRAASHLRSPFVLFLSHRSVDKTVVEQVASEIKRKGVAIWFDKERLVPSDSLVREISRGLEQMTHFVLFWSKACAGAPWVERELNAATAKLIERRLPILIVRLDSTPVPDILADLYRLEGSDMSPTEIGSAVVDAVQRLAKRGGS
jgi:hypothetical protein